jgi:ABC-type Zn2+ transport system substrate-binding protein/surface adhesin
MSLLTAFADEAHRAEVLLRRSKSTLYKLKCLKFISARSGKQQQQQKHNNNNNNKNKNNDKDNNDDDDHNKCNNNNNNNNNNNIYRAQFFQPRYPI